jgi:hypothetical protein
VRGKMQGKVLKIICVVDIDPDSNLSSGIANGNVISKPDTELSEFIQGGSDKLIQGGCMRCRCLLN